MKKLLLLFFLLCLPYKAFAGFVDAINCDDIPVAQRNANALICLQSTTAGGRSPGIGYLWNGTVWIQYSNIPRVAVAALPAVPKTGDVVVVTDALNSATCIVAGGIAANICQWTGAAWSPIGGGGGSSGHLFKDETLDLANQPLTYINCTGGGIACTSNVGTNSVDITVTAGAEADPVVGAITGVVKGDGAGNIAAANATDLPYTPAGDIAANTVGGAIAELDKEKQPLDADLTALAANVTAGFWAAATNVARTMATASANNITITNPAGIAGNPTWDVGPNVALTTRSFTVGNFDYDFGGAASLGFPRATGAAPTTPSRCAFDLTSQRYKCGLTNGSTVTLAVLSEVQLLNANLTSFASLTGLAGEMVYWTAANTLARTTGLSTGCADVGGNHWNTSANGTWVCGTSTSGALSGLTGGKIPKALTASTVGDSIISESGGNISVAGGFIVGTGPYLTLDTSAIAASDKTWTVLNFSGTIRPSTGALTPGNIVTTNANGLLIDGGGAGAGDVTLNGTQELTNKTIKNADAGGTGNVVTIGIAPYWDAESLTLPSGSTCTQAAVAAINSGPSGNFVNCTDAATSIFEGRITLKQAVATVNFHLTVNDVDSSSQHFAGNFQAMCRNNNTAVGAWAGTVQAVDITMATANNNYTGTTPTLTPNGTCSAGATLFWNFTVDTTPFTDGGNARVIGVLMKQVS